MKPTDERETLDVLGERLTEAEQGMRARRRGLIVPTLAGVALLVGLSFTPPGRVFAGEIGDLVGIGDEPSVEQRFENEADAVVVDAGKAPGGSDYEIVALTSFQVSIGEMPGNPVIESERTDELCFSLDIPSRGDTNGICFTSENFQEEIEERVVRGRLNPAPAVLRPETELIVSGHASAEVADVSVTYIDEDGNEEVAPVGFGRLTTELADEIGSERIGGAFYAFLPTGLKKLDDEPPSAAPRRFSTLPKPPRVTITALGDSGEVIARSQADRSVLSPVRPVSFQDLGEDERSLGHFLRKCEEEIALEAPLRPECEIRPVFGKPGVE